MRRLVMLLILTVVVLVALVGGAASAGPGADPRFAPPKDYDNPGRGTPQNLIKGDFDEDGVVDLVMAVADSPNDVSLFEGRRNGTFVKPPKQFDVARSAVYVIKSDFDGDGHLDLAVSDIGKSSTAPGAVVVLLGKGDGTFKEARSFPSGGKQPTGLAALDVDGDDEKDLAVANAMPGVGNGAFRNVTVLKNNGAGVFKAGQSVETGRGPNGAPLFLSKGDFDRDGDPDLVATVPGSDAVAFLKNERGRYELARSVEVGQDPQSIIARYLNGDRKLDFANTNAESNDVSVRLGEGDGTFRKTGDFPSGGVGPTSLRARNLNNDGEKDLAVTNIGEGPGGGGNVGVLPGRSDGTFRRAVTFHAGNGPAGIVPGKFGGDGRVDLAVANAFSNNLSVLLNTTRK